MNEIATRLQQILEKKNIKQAELAKTLRITDSSVSTMCSGKSNPSNQSIAMICMAYNINEDWLRYGKEPMDAPLLENPLVNFAKQRNLSPDVCVAIDKLLNLPNETLEGLANLCVEIAGAINGTEQPKTQAAVSAAETIINGSTKQINNINHAENSTFNAT